MTTLYHGSKKRKIQQVDEVVPTQNSPRLDKASAMDDELSVSGIGPIPKRAKLDDEPSFSVSNEDDEFFSVEKDVSLSSSSSSRSRSSSSSSSSEQREVPEPPRPAPSGKPLARVRKLPYTQQWKEDDPLFPKNTVPNLMSMARVMMNASAPEGDDEDSIYITKQAAQLVEEYLKASMSQIVTSAVAVYNHHPRKRMNGGDIMLAVDSNPQFAPFNPSEFMQRQPELAPALTTTLNNLKAGVSTKKSKRILFQHTTDTQ